MALSREQSISQYGTEAYTAWDKTEADADWVSRGAVKAQPSTNIIANPPDQRFAGRIDESQIPSVQSFVQGQFAGEDTALNELVAQMRAQEKPLDIYGRLETEAGLPQLRLASTTLSKEIANLEDVLEGIEPDVAARTRESLVTEAQRRGLVQAGREPFLEKLGKFGTALGRVSGRIGEAERGIATKTELGLRGQEMELEPLKLRFTVMVDRNARLLTGFTEDRQTQLDILWDKLRRTRQLSDQEWELANTLGSEERNYKMTLQTAAANAGYQVTGQESIDELLGIVGTKAAEQIAFERAQAGKGTAGEREAKVERERLTNDVKAGSNFEDVILRYAGILSTSEIRSIYNQYSRYGPATNKEAEVAKWIGTEYGTAGGPY